MPFFKNGLKELKITSRTAYVELDGPVAYHGTELQRAPEEALALKAKLALSESVPASAPRIFIRAREPQEGNDDRCMSEVQELVADKIRRNLGSIPPGDVAKLPHDTLLSILSLDDIDVSEDCVFSIICEAIKIS